LGTLIDAHPNVQYRFQPLFSYAFKDRLTPISNRQEIKKYFDDIEQSRDGFLLREEAKEKGIVPVFNKKEAMIVAYKEVRYHHILANMLAVDPDMLFVGLIRNPFDVLYSWWKAPREFRSDLGWDFNEEWLTGKSKNEGRPEEFYGYLKWKEAANIFLDLEETYPNRVRVVSYTNLVNNVQDELEKVMALMGLDIDSNQVRTIEVMNSKNDFDPYSVFRINASLSSGQTYLPRKIIDSIVRDLEFDSLKEFLNPDYS
jgi:hypothetical protein